MTVQLHNKNKFQMYYFTYYVFVYFVYATAQMQDNIEIPTSYEGAQVWRINFQDSGDDVRNFLGIKKLIDEQDISLWHLSSSHMDFLVQANNQVKVNRILESRNLAHSVLILDVQRKLDSLKAEPTLWDEKTLRLGSENLPLKQEDEHNAFLMVRDNAGCRMPIISSVYLGHRLNFKEYPTLRIIYEYFNYIAENFPSICTLTTIGYSEHNNPIQMIKISNGNPENKALMITSGQHGREWTAVAATLYVLDYIVAKFDKLPDQLKFVEWLFIPVLNPDGYDYTHTHDRLWRKNRRKFFNCTGVDINRNFGLDWDVPGYTEKNECHDAYSGPHAFSEAESIALRNVISNTKKKPSALIDMHAYAQLILFPWSGRANETPDAKLHWKTAKAMADAIKNSTDQTYDIGVTYHKIYPATGTATDWIYSSGVTRSFAMEARNGGIHGFLASPEQIKPAGKDLLAAASQLAVEINAELVKRRGSARQWV